MADKLPDWYTPEAAPAPIAAAPVRAPDWYVSESAPSAPKGAGSMARNALGMVMDVPGAIAGAPRALGVDLPSWITAKAENALTGSNLTGADVRAQTAKHSTFLDPSKVLPSTKGINDAVYGAAGVDQYEPQSLMGKLARAFGTGALSGGLTNPRSWLDALTTATKTGTAMTGAEAAHETFPNSDIAPVVAAIAAHSATGLAGNAARSAFDVMKPIISPVAAGSQRAAQVASQIDNSLPGVANPSPQDLLGASGDVRSATDAFGPGAHPPAVMGAYRDFLDTLKGHLESARNTGSAPFYNAFRAEPLMDPPEVASKAVRDERWPLGLPAVAPAMGKAATNMRNDRGGNRAANNPYGGPLGTKAYTDFNEAGDPVYKTAQVPTPDLLDRTKRQLNIGATQASMKADSDTAASKTNAAAQMTEFIKKQYPDTYPQALDAHTKGSEPLTPFEHPDVAKTLARNESTNGTDQGPVMGNAELLNHIGASASPGESVQAFIDAVGDKKTALKPLQDAIVGHLRDTPGVVDPSTGEVDAKALDQATRKYMPTVSSFFPDLGKKFGTAKAAQATLDNMRAQETIADGVLSRGELRDKTTGAVTKDSFNSWLKSNEKTLAQTQSPGAVMRLRQIGQALEEAPGEGALAAAKATPLAGGLLTGGADGGIGGLLAKEGLAAPTEARMRRFREAYSHTIERIVTDPAEANRIGALVARVPKGSKWNALARAVRDQIGEGAAYAPITTAPARR